MQSFLLRVSRLGALPLLSIVVLALALTGCYTQLGTVASSGSAPGQTMARTAVGADSSPSSDASDRTSASTTDTLDAVDDFLQDFDHYALKYLDPSDRALVERATRLLEKRSESEISRATYRDRLNSFRVDHPDFYGNFFGDPFYATYDLQYTRLAELRQRINTFVNPQNSVRSTESFYCSPFSYDPNFGGVCRGLRYAASDFFFLPSGSFSPSSPITLSARSDITFAQVYGPSSLPLLTGYEAGDDRSRPVAEADGPSPSPVHGDSRGERARRTDSKKSSEGLATPLPPDASSNERAEKLRVPSEVQSLSGAEIASLTTSLREGLSENERSALAHLLTSWSARSSRSVPSAAQVRTTPDLELRVETIRRASQGRLYGSRLARRGGTPDRSPSSLSDVSSAELLDRLDRRRGRLGGSSGSPTADRSTHSSDRPRRTVGRSIRSRGTSGTDSSSGPDTVDQSNGDQGSSSGRTGRDSGDSDR